MCVGVWCHPRACAAQCLSNIPELTNFVLRKEHMLALNKRARALRGAAPASQVRGAGGICKGAMAVAWGELIGRMWAPAASGTERPSEVCARARAYV